MTLTGFHILVLGGGTIGAGWAAGFAGAGARVSVVDPNPASADTIAALFDTALPILRDLGTCVSDPIAPIHCLSLDEVDGTPDFVQEALPERLPLKQDALRAIEDHISDDVVIASSSSGYTASEIQEGLRRPQRVVIGHPCNPPYLMPVVELGGGKQTTPDYLNAAQTVYEAAGKTVLRVNKELPGHLVNRLQAALWREAVHMATQGVASVADIERAVTQGLGPRWSVVGPTTIFDLAGGDSGLAKFFDDLGDEVDRWWDSLGTPSLTPENRALLVEGMKAARDGRTSAEIAARRDRLVPRVMGAVQQDRTTGSIDTSEGGKANV